MTIVAQIQNLRGFVTNNLSDTIDWNKHVKVDEKQTTGDLAFVEIKTPFNRYKLSMGSAYANPPHGAPDVCRSLGWVTFDHIGEDKHVLGPKNELTYRDIAKHINERELVDALADARGKVAEAGELEVADARMKLREVAARAEKHGIKANLPEEPPTFIAPRHSIIEKELLAQGYVPHPEPLKLSAPAPFIGAPIIYYCADRIAGMEQVPGILIRIQHDGRAALQLFADLNEIQFKDNIHRRGADAGNGRVHTTNCWDFNPEWLKEQKRVKALEDEVDRLRSEAMDRITRLEGAVIALEAKPKRGRPPKDRSEGGEIEGAELASELGPEDA